MFLVVDSSLATSVAVVSSLGEILSERSSTDPRGHAENIGALLQEALDVAGVTPVELTHVVMGVGPGPFTGLRVGMAAAEAFALSRSLPLVPIISHDAPAHGAGDCVVITDARRGEIAYSVYAGEGAMRRVQGPALCRPENLDTELGEYSSLSHIQAGTISAGHLGQVAATYLESGVPLASPAPQYLRAPDVTVMP
jgi:tRNA threonylcarbamoyl adenosine modification protein YeaZ